MRASFRWSITPPRWSVNSWAGSSFSFDPMRGRPRWPSTLDLAAFDFCRLNPDMRGDQTMGKDMTEQTARAEDEAAMPREAALQPSPSTALEREHAEMRDRLLRTLAEMENLRKRTEREVADSRLYGVTSFARDMLVVADNMRRALEAGTPELRANSAAKAP